MNIIKDKLTTFFRFQIILISIFEWFKKFFHNFTYFVIIIISMLSLFECITRSSSLSIEQTKLFAIVYWIFYLSDFLRIFMSFKYALILLRYSSTDGVLFLRNVTFVFNTIVTAKITYSHWFIIIFFFFIPKKSSDICKYYIFNSFIFFSCLKTFLIFLIILSIMLSFLFLL